MHSWDDTWLPADLCKDLDDDCGRGKKRFDRKFDRKFDRDFDRDRTEFKDDRKDFKDDDCGCDDSRDDWKWRKHKRRKAIPVGNISVDCTPVTFRTPGQAINVVSCPVTEVTSIICPQTFNVQVPLGFGGCVLNVPVTQQVQVPVVTTFNVPPIQTPVPTVVCPSATSSIFGC